MLPHHIVTAVHFLTLNLTHRLPMPLPRVIGVSLFTGRVDTGQIRFALDSFVPSPADPPAMLLSWLEQYLHDRATLAGYRLGDAAALLRKMPGARRSPVLRALAGQNDQPIIDMVALRGDGRPLPFASACAQAGLPCSAASAADDFTGWMTGRRAALVHQLEVDVLASWRMAMHRLARQAALGSRVTASIDAHLATWLRQVDFPAGAIHLESLARTTG